MLFFILLFPPEGKSQKVVGPLRLTGSSNVVKPFECTHLYMNSHFFLSSVIPSFSNVWSACTAQKYQVYRASLSRQQRLYHSQLLQVIFLLLVHVSFSLTIWFSVLLIIVQVFLEILAIVFFSALVWMASKEANDRVAPHLKLCMHQLKEKLRLELHRKYLETSLKTPKRDFGKS